MGVKHPGPPMPVPFSHGKPKRVFTIGKRASTHPSGHQYVSKVYPNAIEIPGQLGVMKGLMTFGGVFSFGISIAIGILTASIFADILDSGFSGPDSGEVIAWVIISPFLLGFLVFRH